MTRRAWTVQEITILQANYNSKSAIDLIHLFHRRWAAIKSKAIILGLSRSTYQNRKPSRIRVMSNLERVYVACAIDTEGCIVLGWYYNGQTTTKKYPKIRVQVGNTNLEWLQHIQRLIGCGSIQKQNPSPLSKKQSYQYFLSRRPEIADLLKQIQPYLVIKPDKANKVLNLIGDGEYLGTFPEPMEARKEVPNPYPFS